MSDLITLGIHGGSAAFSLDVSGASRELTLDITRDASGGTPYVGPYEVTPTKEEQTLPTIGCKLAGNITVAPIPNNYGLITYNGSTILVS